MQHARPSATSILPRQVSWGVLGGTPDPTCVLRLASISFVEMDAVRRRLPLLGVEIEGLTDGVAPPFGGKEMCFDPLPTCMVSQCRRLVLVDHDGQERVRLHFASARVARHKSAAPRVHKADAKGIQNANSRSSVVWIYSRGVSGSLNGRAAPAFEPPPVDEEARSQTIKTRAASFDRMATTASWFGDGRIR